MILTWERVPVGTGALAFSTVTAGSFHRAFDLRDKISGGLGLGQAPAGALDSFNQRAANNHRIGEFNDPCGLLRSGNAKSNTDWNRRHPSHLGYLRTQLLIQGSPRSSDSGHGYVVNKTAGLSSHKF